MIASDCEVCSSPMCCAGLVHASCLSAAGCPRCGGQTKWRPIKTVRRTVLEIEWCPRCDVLFNVVREPPEQKQQKVRAKRPCRAKP
jgi:hypothetical protein